MARRLRCITDIRSARTGEISAIWSACQCPRRGDGPAESPREIAQKKRQPGQWGNLGQAVLTQTGGFPPDIRSKPTGESLSAALSRVSSQIILGAPAGRPAQNDRQARQSQRAYPSRLKLQAGSLRRSRPEASQFREALTNLDVQRISIRARYVSIDYTRAPGGGPGFSTGSFPPSGYNHQPVWRT